jgi:hypothetical protein
MRIRLNKRVYASFFLVLLISSFILSFTTLHFASAAVITRIQGNARGTTTSTSLDVTLDSTPTEGNLLIACIGTHCEGSLPTVVSVTQDGVTWTKCKSDMVGAYDYYYGNIEIWQGVVDSSTSTDIAILLSATPLSYCAIADVCEYSGLLSSGLDVTASNNGTSTSQDTGTTDTTTQDNELWVGAILKFSGSQTTPTEGFTLLDGEVTSETSVAYLEKIVSSNGTANSGTTSASGDYWVGCIATFKAAVASAYPYVNNVSDVDSTADVGTHSNFTAQQYGPDAINDTLTEANTGGSSPTYTEMFTNFTPSGTGWTTDYDIYGTNGVPPNSVVEIVATNGNTGSDVDLGVRSTSSSDSRYLMLHEAESDGVQAMTWYCQVDSSGLIDYYASTTTGTTFYIMGYWTGTAFTEEFTTLTVSSTSTWEDETLSTASRVYMITAYSRLENGRILMGARANGGAVGNRYIYVHECENTGDGGTPLAFLVKSDASAIIDIYSSSSSGTFRCQGYFDSNMDFVEAWDTLDSSTNWQDSDLTAYLDEDGRAVSILSLNGEYNTENMVGIRNNDQASGNRYLDIHESENAAGISNNYEFNGYLSSSVTDVDGVIELYKEDSSNTEHYLEGYWIPASATNYELQIEEQFTDVPYDSGDVAELCVASGNFSSVEALNMQVWNGTWNTVGQLTVNQWSNFTVTTFVNSTDFYIRFLGGSESSDTEEDTWEIDVTYLLIYNYSAVNETFVLEATVSFDSTLVYKRSLLEVFSQTVALDSSLLSSKALQKPFIETLAITESLLTNKALSNTFAFTVSPSDLLISSKGVGKVFAQSVAFGDVFASGKGLFKPLLATVAVAGDTTTTKTLNKMLLEPLALTADLFKNRGLFALLLESLSVDASLLSTKGINVLLSEILNVSAVLDVAKQIFANILEVLSATLNVTDDLVTQKSLGKLLSDTFVVNDVLVLQKGLSKVLVDSLTVDASLLMQKGISHVLAEVVAFTSSLNTLRSMTMKFFELFGVASVNAVLDVSKGLNYILYGSLAVDAASFVQKGLLHILSEVIALSSNLGSLRGIINSFFECFGVATIDSVLNVQKSLGHIFTENVAMVATLISQKAMNFVVSASLSVSSYLSTLTADIAVHISFVLSEVFNVSSNLISQKTLLIVLSGSIGIGSLLVAAFQDVISSLTVVLVETVSVVASLGTTFNLHHLLFELIGSIDLGSLLNPHLPVGLFSIDDVVAGAIIGGLIAGVVCFALFMIIRGRDDDD